MEHTKNSQDTSRTFDNRNVDRQIAKKMKYKMHKHQNYGVQYLAKHIYRQIVVFTTTKHYHNKIKDLQNYIFILLYSNKFNFI